MGVGVVVALALTLFDTRTFHRLAWVVYAIVIVLLLFVLVKGRYVMGARRWIGFGPVNLQPSELAKLAVALALASWFHADAEKRKDGYGLLGLAIPLGITLLPAVLTLQASRTSAPRSSSARSGSPRSCSRRCAGRRSRSSRWWRSAGRPSPTRT